MNSLPGSLAVFAALALTHVNLHAQDQQLQPQSENPKIDYRGFLQDAGEVGKLRHERRISEEKFIAMAAEPDTVVLDARSAEKFKMLHVRGAKNLSLPDITAEQLARIIPDKTTRVLIYCNNNFKNEEPAFPEKRVSAALNIYTFNTLYAYGYRNIYELGPLIDIKDTNLPLEGDRVVPPEAIKVRFSEEQQQRASSTRVDCRGPAPR